MAGMTASEPFPLHFAFGAKGSPLLGPAAARLAMMAGLPHPAKALLITKSRSALTRPVLTLAQTCIAPFLPVFRGSTRANDP